MSKWSLTTLHDKIDIKHGYPFEGKLFADSGDYIVLTPGNFVESGGFKREPGKEKYYLGDIPDSYLHKKGDLIVAMTEQTDGLLGSCAIVPEDNLYLHNQRLGLITVCNGAADKMFIYHLFKSRFIRRQLRLTATGSKVKHTSPDRIYDLKVYLPPVAEQKKIAAVLSSLDAKIDINNRINAESESMVKTLYNYWFVQFDFPDKNGKPYKSSGGKMVYDEQLKREIPEGWGVNSLWDIADYFNGLAMQNYRPVSKDYLKVIKIREMNGGFSDSTEKARTDIPKEAIIDNGDILFSWSATLDVKVWSKGKGALNQHIFKVTSKHYPKSFIYFELLNYLHHFKMLAERRKTTMGHITQEHLKQSRIIIPKLKLIKELEGMVSPVFKKMLILKQENQQLTQLRDWLLPMLMNGQVRVV